MAKLKGLARLAVAAGFGIVLALGAAAPAFADVTAKAGDARAADVATVGGTGYGTLADAFDAVPADGTETTVMLAADVSGQSEIVVPEGKSVVLDLAGHKIETAEDPARGGGAHFYAFTNNGSLTIKDSVGAGSIEARGVWNSPGATLTFAGGFINALDAGGGAVYNEGAFFMTGGTLGTAGGYDGDTAAVPLSNCPDATATLTGGSFCGPLWAIWNNGTLTAEDVEIASDHPSGLPATWNCVKAGRGSTTTLTDVTIEAKGNGGIEAAGGTVTLNDCTITQTGAANPQSWNAMCVAASGGGELTVNGGTYTAEGWGVYVFNSGATVNVNGGSFTAKTAIRADAADAAQSYVNVTEGTFNGALESTNEDSCHFSLSGGTFSEEPEQSWLAEGYVAEQNADGMWEVGLESPVASVNGVEYATLQAAVDAAGPGDTVTLLADNKPDKPLKVAADKSVVLDLGGHTLQMSVVAGSVENYQDPRTFDKTHKTFSAGIVNEGDLTIENGTYKIAGFGDGIVNTGSLTIGSDAAAQSPVANGDGRYLIANFGGEVETSGMLSSAANNAIVTYGGTVDITGGQITATGTGCSVVDIYNRGYDNASAGADVTVSGGSLECDSYVASTNHNYGGGDDPSNLTVTGGTLKSYRTSIYWPTSGTVTIGSAETGEGPDIESTNGSGIEICSGTLNVYGGTLAGGTAHEDKDSYATDAALAGMYRQMSGASNAGDAVTIVSHRAASYAGDPLSVRIEGGTFTSAQNYGVRYLSGNQGTDGTSIDQDVAVSITGGEFTGKIDSIDAAFADVDERKFVSGGSFGTSGVGDYLAPGAAVVVTSGETPFDVYPSEDEALENGGAYKVVDGNGTSWVFDDEQAAADFAEANGAEVATVMRAVTFDDLLAETENEVVEVPNGQTVPRPDDPVCAGWRFLGWYSDADRTVAYDFSAAVTKDIVLYAKWEKLPDEPADEGSAEPSGDAAAPEAPGEGAEAPAEGDALPMTGDILPIVAGIVAAAGVVAAGVGIALSRRRR